MNDPNDVMILIFLLGSIASCGLCTVSWFLSDSEATITKGMISKLVIFLLPAMNIMLSLILFDQSTQKVQISIFVLLSVFQSIMSFLLVVKLSTCKGIEPEES